MAELPPLHSVPFAKSAHRALSVGSRQSADCSLQSAVCSQQSAVCSQQSAAGSHQQDAKLG